MKTLEQWVADLSAADEKIDVLLQHDELAAEQQAEHDTLVSGRAKIVAAIGREKGRLAREEERQDLQTQATAAKKKQERTVKPGDNRLADADATNPNDVPAERIAAIARNFAIPATARLVAAPKNFRGMRNGHSAEQRAYRFGMWAMAVLAHQLPYRYGHLAGAIEFVQRQNLTVTSKDASGTQYLILPEFSLDIIDLREQYGVVRRIFKLVPMLSDTKQIPRRQSGLTAYFPGEANAGTTSNKAWDNVKLTARKLMVISTVSNEVNEDLAISWGDDLIGEISFALAKKEDECGMIGDGSSTYDGINGLLTKIASATASLVTGAGNSWTELTLANFTSVLGKLPVYARTPQTCWVCSSTFYYSVMLQLMLAQGGTDISQTADGGAFRRPMFLGYPVEFSQVYPMAEANSQVPVTFGDHTLAAAFGDRGLSDVEFSDQAYVDSVSLWQNDLLGVRCKERMDINVHDVGDTSVAGPVVGLITAGS